MLTGNESCLEFLFLMPIKQFFQIYIRLKKKKFEKSNI